MDSCPYPAKLAPKHIQVLKDIRRFAQIGRYHGMLPEKHALMYEQGVLDFLEELNLIEIGTVIAQCGAHMTGYRLTEGSRRDLKAMGVELDAETAPRERSTEDEDGCLTSDQIEILADLFHISRVKKFGGITPKEMLDEYDKKDVKVLYELGYILYIKLKGKAVKHGKGYILTDQSLRLLRRLGKVA